MYIGLTPNSFYVPGQFTPISMGLITLGIYAAISWANSCQIWYVSVFHHVVLKYGPEYAEMPKKKGKFDDITVQYSLIHHYNFSRIRLGVCMLAQGFIETILLQGCNHV